MAILKVWMFFENWRDKLYTKAVKWNALVNFANLQILSDNFSKKCGYFDKKAGTNLEADTFARLFQQQKTMVLWKTLWLFGLFSGDKRCYIDMSMIKITIKSNQIDIDVFFFQK